MCSYGENVLKAERKLCWKFNSVVLRLSRTKQQLFRTYHSGGLESMSPSFVLITRMPGIGKTTLVKRLIDEVPPINNRMCGFYTEEIRNQQGNRIGFDVVSLDAPNRGILARNDQTCGTAKHKVGNYSVYTSSLDTFLRPIYQCRSMDILVIDEIGKMELKSDFFANFISEIIGTGERDRFPVKVVVATVPVVRSIPIVERIKSLPKSKLFTVTKANRNGIYDDIKAAIDVCLKLESSVEGSTSD